MGLIVLLLNERITMIEMLTMAMLCILTIQDWSIDLSVFVNILLDAELHGSSWRCQNVVPF